MSQRAENRFRLELYRELDDIVSAMKNLAQVELLRVSKAESVQAGAWLTALSALQQLPAQPATQTAGVGQTLILLGTERGFCGGFNEQVARGWEAASLQGAQVLAVGGRLANKLPARALARGFAAPATTDAVLPCMEALIDHLLQQPLPASLKVLSHTAAGVTWESLLPVTAPPSPGPRSVPQIQLPLATLRAELQWQVIQQGLLRLLLVSLKIENRHRLQQMEGALEHLENLTQDLRLRINALRQQEIVEEIEVILADQPAGPFAL